MFKLLSRSWVLKSCMIFTQARLQWWQAKQRRGEKNNITHIVESLLIVSWTYREILNWCCVWVKGWWRHIVQKTNKKKKGSKRKNEEEEEIAEERKEKNFVGLLRTMRESMAASEDIVHMVRPEAISIRSRLDKSNMLPIADDDSHQKGCCLLIGSVMASPSNLYTW